VIELFAARHAPVATEGICYGRTDVETRESAEASAEALIATFEGEAPAIVWSSPMRRCLRVAEILAARWKAALRVDDALHELHFGDWEGRTWLELAADDHYARWLEQWRELAPPNGETPRDIEARVRRWCACARALERDNRHALVAHAGVVRALSVILEKRSWIEAMSSAVPHLAWRRWSVASP
jgi:alpha-ribazole phosphatase